jgi:hexosaminidase
MNNEQLTINNLILTMKNFLILLMVLSVTLVNGQQEKVSLIPQPVDLQVTAGSFLITPAAVISYNNPEGRATADMLVQKLSVPAGYNLKAVQGKAGAIQFNLNTTADQKLGTEGYTLVSTSKGVIITANNPAGLFYGMNTLLQLLPKEIEGKKPASVKWKVPLVKITDYPRFAWRGLMLDVSRNFFTKDEVKQYIDEMARFKFNIFHWHLTDDNGWRIEIKSLPKLTEVGAWRVPRYGHFGERIPPNPGEPATDGGFYTQDDIREIVKYARERNITIVPEIDVPGHSMAAVASYPELCCTKDPAIQVNPGSNFSEWFGDGTFKMLIDNTLNPSDEKVYEFLDKVFTEVAALFPGPYIHVGGDECYKGYWEKDPGCQALMKKLNFSEVEKLQGYFMNRLEGILKTKGKKLLGWDEILEGGISPNATVMSWRGIKGGIEAARLGHDVVMSPTTFAYLDYLQGDPSIEPPLYAQIRMQKCYGYEPVPEGVDAKYILGGQGNLWTEQIPTLRHAFYMTYPRSWALSEVFWTPAQLKNWDNFVQRVENQFSRSDESGINYSKAIYDAIVRISKQEEKMKVELDSEVPGLDIYYTIDGTMPDNFSPKYTQPVSLPDGPISMRVITYRRGSPIGHLIILKPEDLKARAEQKQNN